MALPSLYLFLSYQKLLLLVLIKINQSMLELMILAGLWLLIFSLYFSFGKKAPAASDISNPVEIIKSGWNEIIKVRFARFFVARMFYADGLSVVFAFAGIFAAKVFGFANTEVSTLLLR